MSYIDKLCSYTDYGKKGSKEFLKNYYLKQNNFHKKLKVIHVTGTSGKGSTVNMISKGLVDAGYKVGTFTSPHIFKINERIKVNLNEISDEKLEFYAKKFILENPDSPFSEILTMIMVEYFFEEKIDYAVIEVFVGGKYDPTNIFDSIVTVITSIGKDHIPLLGNNENEILKNKLGVLRENVPLFTRINNKLIKDYVTKKKSKLILVKGKIDTNLNGEFQKENAAIAFEVLKYLKISEDKIKNSLMNILWKGRIEYIGNNIIIDGAHNELGMKALKEYIKTLKYENLYYLFAISKGKDYLEFRKEFLFAKEIVLTKPNMFKIEDPKNYATGKELIIENPQDAFYYLKNKLGERDLLVVCGSLYLAPEILKLYENK